MHARTTCGALRDVSLHPPSCPAPGALFPPSPSSTGWEASVLPTALGPQEGAVSHFPQGWRPLRGSGGRPGASGPTASCQRRHGTHEGGCSAVPTPSPPRASMGHDPPFTPTRTMTDTKPSPNVDWGHGRGETAALAHGRRERKRVSPPRRAAQQLLQDLVPADPDVHSGGHPSPQENVSANVPGSPPRGSGEPKPAASSGGPDEDDTLCPHRGTSSGLKKESSSDTGRRVDRAWTQSMT